MRITNLMAYEQIKKSLQGSLEEVARRNEELATGKRILRPSDDPTGVSKSIDIKIGISRSEQYLRNIDKAELQFQYTDQVLTSVADTLVELRKLTSFGINPADSQSRDFNSIRAAQLRDYLLQLSNSKYSERFIFSGYRTDRYAFVYNPSTFSYAYQGDTGEFYIPISCNSGVAVNIPGSKVFSPVLKGNGPSQLSDGTPLTYTQSYDPATGINTITIEIGDPLGADYDVFTVTNIMDISNVLSYAWRYQATDGSSIGETKAMHRVEALSFLIDDARTQVLEKQTELATRQSFLKDEMERTKQILNNLRNSLSKTEDADLTEVAVEIKKAETALQAMQLASSRLLSGSLLDFLK